MKAWLKTVIARSWNLRWLVALNLFLVSPILIYDFKLFEGLTGLRDPVALFNLLVSLLFLGALQVLFARPWKFHLLILPLYVVVLAELFLIVEFRSRLTTSYIAIILNEFEHTGDFFATYAPEVLTAVSLFCIGYGLALWKSRAVTLAVPRRWVWVPLCGLVLVYGGTTYRQMKVIPADLSGAWLDVLGHDKNSPFGVFSQGYMAFRFHRAAQEQLKKREGFRFGATKEGGFSGAEVHVLVLGETSRPDHWGINGYERDTSPRLTKTPHVVSFTDAIAEVALTQLSVPMILTRATAADVGDRGHERSIVTAFGEAGYETYWFTTQQWDIFTAGINHYAAEADHVRYFERRHDAVLLEAMDEALANAKRPLRAFLVLHTQGSHIEYSKRYPEEFKVFPQDSPKLTREEYLVNTYDNSLLYTDYVLSEVIRRLSALDAVTTMLYVSDHGDNLLDDERELLGHFHNNEYDLPTAMLFWGSDAFAQRFPSKMRAVQENAGKPITTANVFHTLLDAGGITMPESGGGLSLLNPALELVPRLIVREDKVQDYDVLFGSKR